MLITIPDTQNLATSYATTMSNIAFVMYANGQRSKGIEMLRESLALSREALGQVHFCALAPEGPRAWRSFTASLPAAGGHQLALLPEAARHTAPRDDFLLLPRTPEEAPLLHFRFLDRRVDLPLHAGWRTWLWERALRAGEAVALEAEGIAAYRCSPDPDALVADASAAVRAGVLRPEAGSAATPTGPAG